MIELMQPLVVAHSTTQIVLRRLSGPRHPNFHLGRLSQKVKDKLDESLFFFFFSGVQTIDFIGSATVRGIDSTFSPFRHYFKTTFSPFLRLCWLGRQSSHVFQWSWFTDESGGYVRMWSAGVCQELCMVRRKVWAMKHWFWNQLITRHQTIESRFLSFFLYSNLFPYMDLNFPLCFPPPFEFYHL